MRRSVLLVVMVLLGAPGLAHAGTVSIGTVRTDYKYPYEGQALQFRALPGERNRIAVSRMETGGPQIAVLHDAGAPLTAAEGCTQVDERTVSCRAYNPYLDIDAGDGDDTVTLPTGPLSPRGDYIRGGAGSDVLTGQGFLAGGPGNDLLTCPEACRGSVLAGGGDDDRLVGGREDDVLSGDGDGPPHLVVYETRLTESAGAGNDIIDGGNGRDTLSFRGRHAGVHVDLGAGNAAGAAGERDHLAAIEDIEGGAGDDLLIGDDADNVVQGASGNDRIDGRAGNDYLLGNLIPDTNDFSPTYTPPDPGADTLRGGAGNDRLDAGSERGDALFGGPGNDILEDGVNLLGNTHARTVRCGSGRDLIDFAPRGQLLSDCEVLRPVYSQARIALRPQRRAGGRLRFAWTCRHDDGCAMAVGVRVPGSRLARHQTSTEGPARRAVLLRTRPPARRGDIADITILVQTGNSTPYAARWRIKL